MDDRLRPPPYDDDTISRQLREYADALAARTPTSSPLLIDRQPRRRPAPRRSAVLAVAATVALIAAATIGAWGWLRSDPTSISTSDDPTATTTPTMDPGPTDDDDAAANSTMDGAAPVVTPLLPNADEWAITTDFGSTTSPLGNAAGVSAFFFDGDLVILLHSFEDRTLSPLAGPQPSRPATVP